jgi:site-specific DNA recombinase
MANRLGWQRVMRDARAAKFDVVVAEALDRISRDQEDLAGIPKRLRFCKIEIRTVPDGTAEEIHVGIKGLLVALYLKDLAQKTKRGHAGVIRDGRHNGGRSFGYRPVPGQPGRLGTRPSTWWGPHPLFLYFGALPVASENYIRAYRWCRPPRIG